MQPLWDAQDGTTVVVLLGAGAVLTAALAVLHDGWIDRFAWTWRTVAGGMALRRSSSPPSPTPAATA